MNIPKQFAAPALILAVFLFGAAFRTPKPVQQQEQHSSDLQRFFLEGGVSIDIGPNWKPSGPATRRLQEVLVRTRLPFILTRSYF